jgi:TRAP-type C4-dicarboxylate transport system substrate-binding protein
MRTSITCRVIGAGMLASTLVFTGCSDGGGAAAAPEGEGSLADMEPIVLTYSESNVETAAHVQAMQGFMEQVTEATDGKITFETFYSAALHPAAEALTAIESGLTDVTFISPSNVPDQMPVGVWETTIAQGEIDSEFPMSLVQGTPVQSAIYAEGPLAEELAAYDAETLAAWGTAPNNAVCKPEVGSADQADGKLIRTPGPPFVDEVEAMGMSSVSLPVTDGYEGLQRGVIDCFMNVISPFMTLGLWDEAKHFIPADFATSIGSQILIKKSVLESLPLEAQQIIFDAKIDLLASIIETTLETNVRWADEAPGKGVVFADPTSFNEAIHAAREIYTKEALANAPEGVSDPEAFVGRLSELSDSSAELVAGLNIESGTPTTEAGWIQLYRSTGDIDWDAYADSLHDYLAPYRP